MKNITICFILFLAIGSLQAQSYQTAVGLRLGTDIGISAQQRVAKFSTVEAIFTPSIRSKETSVELLFEQHKRILSKRFNIYAGGGIHKAWREDDADYFGRPDAGLSGIFGGEFSLKRLNFSWDFKPTIDFLGGEGEALFTRNSSVSIRYIFIPQKKNEDWKVWKKDSRESRKEKKAKEKEKEERKARRKKAGWRIWEW